MNREQRRELKERIRSAQRDKWYAIRKMTGKPSKEVEAAKRLVERWEASLGKEVNARRARLAAAHDKTLEYIFVEKDAAKALTAVKAFERFKP